MMASTAVLPTTRDEDWRYADGSALAELAPESLDLWHEITLSPGEIHFQELILDQAHPGLHRVRLVLGEGARAEIFAIASAGAYTRLEIEVRLARGAHFEFGGVIIGGGTAVREIITRLDHAEPEATSHQVVRAVQWGRSTGNFLGRIEVARDGQKTDAAQNFRAILLEAGASANAKPELEIFADDVKCAHGVAIGAMDEAAAFYMAARGIAPEAARKLLIRAFVADAFAALEDADQREAMLETALSALDGESL